MAVNFAALQLFIAYIRIISKKQKFILDCIMQFVTGFAKTVLNGTRIEIPFIAWHES